MITVLGLEGSPEWDAANHVKETILEFWPDLEETPRHEEAISIAANVKVFGQKVQDVDVVLIGRLKQGRAFQPLRPVRNRDGIPFTGRSVSVRTLALNIEVKDQDASDVRFVGASAHVRYSRGAFPGWKNATEQSYDQMQSIRAYLATGQIDGIYITPLVLLRGLTDRDGWPDHPHLNLPGTFSLPELLTTVAETGTWVSPDGRNAVLSAGKQEAIERVLQGPLFRRIEPTAIDRRRMDLIARRSAVRDEWYDDLGKKQIVFSGRGGAGKTIILLQLAHRDYEDRLSRSLFLTYNRALMADIRRIMTISGVPGSEEQGGIYVESVMSFVGRVLRAFDLLDDGEILIDVYPAKTAMLAQMIRANAITQDDIRSIKERNPESFAFENVFIDEGQDWPPEEIQILRGIYGPAHTVIADGMDQFVRGGVADWTKGLPQEQLRVRRLRRCLRMKSNLAAFANELANQMGVPNWSVEPNPDAHGGKVIIFEGAYLSDLSLHRELVEEAARAGNKPVDLLCCVPPSMVTRDGGERHSSAAMTLSANGFEVWDGVSLDVRQDIPRSTDQLRIVQYDSCRGLEGWTVFALGFDAFVDYKVAQRLADPDKPTDLFMNPSEDAWVHGARWAMIAVTRPMDSIVIEVTGRPSKALEALKRVARALPDIVRWVKA